MPTVTGTLKEFGLFRCLREIARVKSPLEGTIFIKSEGTSGRLSLRNDRFIVARIQLDKDEKALNRIFVLKEGTYSWDGYLWPEEAYIDLPVAGVCYRQLKTLLKADPPQTLLPPDGVPLRFSRLHAQLISAERLSQEETQVLDLVGRGLTSEALVAQSHLGADARKILAFLYGALAIEEAPKIPLKEEKAPDVSLTDLGGGWG
ncbi:MAG: hypothetical protein HZA23_08055 [Nitrospirae bacterium]|nr:hypothetical protein [Nitrospirota bacterium]